MSLTTIPAVVLAAAAATALAAPAAAQQPNPTTTTTNAVTRLVNDSAALTEADAGADTRRALAARAARIQRLSLRRPCRAVRLVRGYRKLLPGVTDERAAPTAGRPGPASKRGTLERDALAVDAGLKQLPGTRRCGGGATKAGAAVDSRVRRSDKRRLKFHVTLPVARWEARSGGGADFIGVNMDGADAIGAVGDPAVPAFTRMFAVPRGARMKVRVTNARGYTLDGIDLFPKQDQAVDQALPQDFLPEETFADKPFKIDGGAYKGRGAVPRRLAYGRIFGKMRDLRIGGVQVPGAQYDPRKRKARIFTSMDVTVTFKKSGKWRRKGARRTSHEKPFERIYRTSLENYGAVRKAGARKAQDSDSDAQEFVPACGEEYLIVTSPTLRPAADTLAASKTAAGMVVGIHEVAPGTDAADVRSFIRGELNNDNCTRPTYVVLLGDTSHVPSFLETCPGIENCQVTSDLSYSLDGIGTDAFADVLLGRITANTLPVAQTTVDKIVRYQTELPAPPGDDFYNHATVTSNFEGLGPRDARGFTLSAEQMRAGLRSRGHVVTRLNTAQATADIQQFKNNTPIPDELKRPATAWTDGRDQVVSELNAGRFLFVHRDHGSRLGWANPGININDIGLLNSNSTELPVVLAINCSSGGFQFPGNPSFTERLLQRQGGGAVAAIADTDVSPTVQNDQLTVGWADAMFPQTVPTFGSSQPLRRMGEILVAGKSYMAAQAGPTQQLTGQVMREHLLWHLLGDPSMEMRTATPSQFDLTKFTTKFEHRRDAFPVGAPPFQVRVTSTQPGTDGATATLLHNGTQVVGRATFSGGVALITPTVRSTSATLSVALERDGFIPGASTLPVSAPVPDLTMTCPADVQVPSQDNIQVGGTVTPRVSGATVKIRTTRPSGAVTTHSTTTLSNSTWAIKIPVGTSDRGNVRIEAFYDGQLKYGADHLDCTVEVR
jgi:hypothetical protein